MDGILTALLQSINTFYLMNVKNGYHSKSTTFYFSEITPFPPLCRSNQMYVNLITFPFKDIFCAFAKLADMVSRKNDDKNLSRRICIMWFQKKIILNTSINQTEKHLPVFWLLSIQFSLLILPWKEKREFLTLFLIYLRLFI